MPTIYDNIDKKLLDGLHTMMDGALRADFCVGYFNLRGWGGIADQVERLGGDGDHCCRLLIGMTQGPDDVVRLGYGAGPEAEPGPKQAWQASRQALEGFSRQLTLGCPTADDEKNLQRLQTQLQDGKVQIRFHGKHPLHAKLYLVHRPDGVAALAGVVGSSNLTLSGLERNGELNVDVLDQDSAQKLGRWFEERWDDAWSLDITADVAQIIENSWAGGTIPPHHIYLKTAWELSREAITGVNEYPLPEAFRNDILDFQASAVPIAARKLERHGGVIIGDVVGLGKTMVACAVAKTLQDDQGDSVLIICPPNLQQMWQGYCHRYTIAAEVWSLGRMASLPDQRRYKLIIVDESHNFRNRESARYGHLRDYIYRNESRLILLTATPYNKAFTDITNQLRLFLPPDRDLGIRPEHQIAASGGTTGFQTTHPQISLSSLEAFEKSEYIEDWRDLMRLFMVRRTRTHIQKNYAEYDQRKKQHYLEYGDQQRFYFPRRTPKRLDFSFAKDGDDDDYAKLYSETVVGHIASLSLARYGLAGYLDDSADVAAADRQAIDNLTRAGKRLCGFARSGLFKRLESSGAAFMLSVRRHIVRNAVFIAALESGSRGLPVGQIINIETDEALDDQDDDLAKDEPGTEDWLEQGRATYQRLHENAALRKNFTWIPSRYFTPQLRENLHSDMDILQQVLDAVPYWQPGRDRKLQALLDLLQNTHSRDKLLIFTQFRDTADYLGAALQDAGVKNLGVAHSDSDLGDLVRRFSPRANGCRNLSAPQLRILIATDVLSEGQNLQDAHIIVNYDLPWAIIRLVQRAGRVDRIGQQAREILCYSAFPEQGIEDIIALRQRLARRMQDNAELVGTDERFFEGDKGGKDLRTLYDGRTDLEDPDDETDLLSRAYDIWHRAEQSDPDLAKRIRNLPNVVYSAKSGGGDAGVVAYISQGGNDILALLNEAGDIVSQSQASILDMLQCPPDTAARPIAANHHQCVRAAVHQLASRGSALGGQLGGNRSVRHKLYKRLQELAGRTQNTEDKQSLQAAAQAVYDRPLTETARQRFRRLFTSGATNAVLQQSVLQMHEDNSLCVPPGQGRGGADIICSMGLV